MSGVNAGPAPVCEAQLSENSLATAQEGPFPEHEATLKIKTKKANEPISLFSFSLGTLCLGAGGKPGNLPAAPGLGRGGDVIRVWQPGRPPGNPL